MRGWVRRSRLVILWVVWLSFGMPPKVHAQTAAQVIRDVRPSVVHVRAQNLNGDSASIGSGFVWDAEGHIVTNDHVVVDAQGQPFNKFCVDFWNGLSADAELVGRDLCTDLAVLKLADPRGVELRPLRLADLDRVQVGDDVLAIGFALELGSSATVTRGIVSAKDREFDKHARIAGKEVTIPIGGAIQTDANINHGNSGGPLVNLAGEVVGVNTWSITGIVTSGAEGGTSVEAVQGIFFAVCAPLKGVVQSILRDGKVLRGFLGVEVTTNKLRVMTGATGNWRWFEGLNLSAVESGSPAALTNLRDLALLPSEGSPPMGFPFTTATINRIGDVAVRTVGDLANALVRYGPGSTVPVRYVTRGVMAPRWDQALPETQLEVKLGQRPETVGPNTW